MERGITHISVPKKGTHGVRVEMFKPFWMQVSDTELQEVFYVLKPYFALKEHRDTDMS